ncbi:aminotransferase class I/II-fold pyridoxal phosphate-dependent enzyme [Rathayibacter toxicus]|uniref:aminotransferase class I/II-fold pyridoxal phosphate-dependent enzyme n=1 Tax=Rathayibacter toxicus TaxID=145458 RepID=UPI000CE74034|nr:aminotransferase class I/II-fold pyridoxal phosphate-dependent enzyme [Rathayibacter toxicus]PPI55355.1 hypothetical protein C5D35_06580 [Rathayibacter toxicus]QOD11313.1 aminotransferase class I/II-fold pyridoxal phosphate-dependent enzyme [Rathayibacter toxicus]QWL28055.1 aminotransferase class I/II-fold pyridoxal phosphate-dependent enzyme [Rathayibacter toxicus]QWL32254.1 aminotransferase class I/II-fold pyridoxal phosphate-dependent enzyme [Rathayibacter toxicus]QWL34347.1 aminotransfe
MNLLTLEHTLTDYEQLGFSTEANLADGHAYHELSPGQASIVDRVSEIWRETERHSIPSAERSFLERFSSLISSRGLREVAGSVILPTASNSIDLVAAYLRLRNSRVLLTHPTFDNLALLLRRRGVPIAPIAENEIRDLQRLSERLADVDVLFLVNPNNPTGTNLSEAEFATVVEHCAKADVSIVIDASFRLYYPQQWDSYAMLVDAGASYIVFEDTGKVFPTQDMKASLLSHSEDHSAALKGLYNELYLCVSKFTLGVLSEFFVDAGTGASPYLKFHDLVETRRTLLRSKVDMAFIAASATESRIGVEWMQVPGANHSDIEFVDIVRSHGLAVLPGRNFFWDSVGSPETTRNFRVSLMKPLREFELGVEILAARLADESDR